MGPHPFLVSTRQNLHPKQAHLRQVLFSTIRDVAGRNLPILMIDACLYLRKVSESILFLLALFPSMTGKWRYRLPPMGAGKAEPSTAFSQTKTTTANALLVGSRGGCSNHFASKCRHHGTLIGLLTALRPNGKSSTDLLLSFFSTNKM
jgi:hypothetical protein